MSNGSNMSFAGSSLGYGHSQMTIVGREDALDMCEDQSPPKKSTTTAKVKGFYMKTITDLQDENRELRQALQEYQSGLDLIMTKYREQTTKLIEFSKINFKEAYDQKYMVIIERLQAKIVELAALIKGTVEADEQEIMNRDVMISRLREENQGLREVVDHRLKETN